MNDPLLGHVLRRTTTTFDPDGSQVFHWNCRRCGIKFFLRSPDVVVRRKQFPRGLKSLTCDDFIASHVMRA